MAKSIRSKSRRKSRSEFRKTIGTVAYNESMAKIQQKLKESLEKQSMNSMDRLAKTLGTSSSDDAVAVNNPDANDIMELDYNNISNKNAIDACDAMTPKIAIVEEKQQEEDSSAAAALSFKGENKAVIRGKKWKRNKLALASLQKKKEHQATSTSSRPKPRYFCKF